MYVYIYRYKFYVYVFYSMHLNIFCCGKVPTFHQTLNGVHGTKRLRTPALTA